LIGLHLHIILIDVTILSKRQNFPAPKFCLFASEFSGSGSVARRPRVLACSRRVRTSPCTSRGFAAPVQGTLSHVGGEDARAPAVAVTLPVMLRLCGRREAEQS